MYDAQPKERFREVTEMPEVDGKVVTSLIDEALRKEPRLTQTAIAEKSSELSAPFSAISPKVLYSAKCGGSIERRNIETIAAVFTRILGREINPSALEAQGGSIEAPRSMESSPTSVPNNQTVSVSGNDSDGIAAAPGATVSVTRQIYRPDS